MTGTSIHPHRAEVAPLAEGAPRPLWSVMIPTFNCARYLARTLESVLAQDPGPERMQIEVVDDCSSLDDPAAVAREVGGGRVGFFRHPANVGQVANFNACLRRSRGRLVHLLHGDDSVRPGFYERMASAFEAEPAVGAAFCRYLVMDEEDRWIHVAALEEPRSGVLEGWLERIGTGQRLQTPGMVVRREVYERLGGFDDRLRYCEDWEMWVRIAAHYPVWYEPEPLAVYRVHRMSVSGTDVRTGENGEHLRRAIRINREHLPADRADEISRRAVRNNAFACVRRAFRFANAGEPDAAWAQVREAVRFSRSPTVLAPLAGVVGFLALKSVAGRAKAAEGGTT
ncbi:MAG TPA: glycosyltransferase [Longimicrobiaceae bacterium]|nr:glycosyltransferase [Longimicrobiaceae bacterium]